MEAKNKLKKTEEKKVKINNDEPTKKVRNLRITEDKPKITFDAYFSSLLSKNNKIRPHHKAPMKDFVKRKGYTEATIEEFDKILERY